MEIYKPVQEVYALYKDRSRMREWQPGFLEEAATTDKNGRPQFRRKFRIGNRTLWMKETVIHDSYPRYDADYTLKGVFNPVRNIFQPTPSGHTQWISESAFRFKWLMKLIAPFLKAGFEKQNRIIMDNFKRYAENKL